MEYLVIALAALIVAVLLIVGAPALFPETEKRRSAGAAKAREPCPLCGEPLESGSRVHSQLLPGKDDRIAHVWGCPRCWPPNELYRRTCPVCRAPLEPAAFVTGRMWEPRPERGRKRAHLHLLGCPRCRVGGAGS